MTRSECLRIIEDALDVPPNTLTEEMELSRVEGWDSIGHLSLMAAFDANLGIVVAPSRLHEASVVRHLVDLAKENLE